MDQNSLFPKFVIVHAANALKIKRRNFGCHLLKTMGVGWHVVALSLIKAL